MLPLLVSTLSSIAEVGSIPWISSNVSASELDDEPSAAADVQEALGTRALRDAEQVRSHFRLVLRPKVRLVAVVDSAMRVCTAMLLADDLAGSWSHRQSAPTSCAGAA